MAGSHSLSEDEALLHFTPNTITTFEARGSERGELMERGGERRRRKRDFFFFSFGETESSRPSHSAPEITFFAYPLLDGH